MIACLVVMGGCAGEKGATTDDLAANGGDAALTGGDLATGSADLTATSDDMAVPVDVDMVGAAMVDLRGATDLTSSPSGDMIAVGSTGCGKTATKGYQASLTINSASTNRSYALFVPASYDENKAYPLVFVFHGSGGTGPGIRSYYALEAAANGKAIFVYPTAIGGNWDLEGAYADNKDLHLFEDLTAQLSSSHCVAPDRVFATGHSNGGFFSNILNCRLGRAQLRAIAPHAGSIYGSAYVDGHVACEGEAAAALLTHGTNDGTVLFSYGEYAWSQWVWANGCSDTTTAYTTSPCVANTGCKAGHPVVWCAVPAINHNLWDQAATVSWAFFESFP